MFPTQKKASEKQDESKSNSSRQARKTHKFQSEQVKDKNSLIHLRAEMESVLIGRAAFGTLLSRIYSRAQLGLCLCIPVRLALEGLVLTYTKYITYKHSVRTAQ